jgi:hypothetical protein
MTPFDPQQARGCMPGCYLIYPVWWHPLTPSRRGGAGLAVTWSIRSGDTLWPPAGEGVQAWLLPDLSGLVTPSDPQQARGCRPGCRHHRGQPGWRGRKWCPPLHTRSQISSLSHVLPTHYNTQGPLHKRENVARDDSLKWQQIFQRLGRLKMKSENKIISFANWDHM